MLDKLAANLFVKLATAFSVATSSIATPLQQARQAESMELRHLLSAYQIQGPQIQQAQFDRMTQLLEQNAHQTSGTLPFQVGSLCAHIAFTAATGSLTCTGRRREKGDKALIAFDDLSFYL